VAGRKPFGPAELSGHAAKAAQVTAETLINEANEVFVRALESGQLSAAVSAIKEKGVLSGKRIERSEVGAAGEFETMADDELECALMERVARLGFADLGETQH
jgi:phage terminase small subunit